MNTTQVTYTFIFFILFYLYLYIVGSATLTILKIRVNKPLAVMTGLMILFSLTELTAFPFMQTKGDYRTFFIIFVSLLLFILIISVNYLFRIKKQFDLLSFNRSQILQPYFFILSFLILLQVIVPTSFARFDGDDAFYIAVSTSIQATGKIFINNPSIGLNEFIFPLNYKFTAYEILITVLSDLTKFDPVVFYHTICPLIFIPMYYIGFCALAKALFPGRNNLKQQYIFVLIICLLTLFDNYSNYLASSFTLLKAWMGKSSTINLCFTTFLTYFIYMIHEETEILVKDTKVFNPYFLLITISLIAGLGTSAIGLYLIPVAYFCLFLSTIVNYSFSDKFAKIKYLLKFIYKSFLSAIPSMLFLIGFIILLKYYGGFTQLNSFESERSWLEDASLIFGNNIILFALYIVSFLYFGFFGSSIQRIIFFINPIILLLTFVNPLLHNLVGHYLTSMPLYWRFFWLFNYFITIAVFMVDALKYFKQNQKLLKIILFIPLILICLPSNFALNETKYYKVENSAKIPDDIAPVVETILSNVNTNDPQDLYLLALPAYNIYLRQYTGQIALVMPRMNFVEEAYTYAGRKHDFYLLKHLFRYDENKIIQGLQPRFIVDDLETLGITLIIAPKEHPELEELYKEIELFNGDYLYIKNEIFKE